MLRVKPCFLGQHGHSYTMQLCLLAVWLADWLFAPSRVKLYFLGQHGHQHTMQLCSAVSVAYLVGWLTGCSLCHESSFTFWVDTDTSTQGAPSFLMIWVWFGSLLYHVCLQRTDIANHHIPLEHTKERTKIPRAPFWLFALS